MAKLIAQSGHSLDLPQRRVTLGESSTCDIPLATGLGLAPAHFEIEPNSEGDYIIRDISGGAGTLVNGEPVLERSLQHGNVIAAGGLQLGFWNTEAPQEAESPFLAGASGMVTEEALAESSVPVLPLPAAEVVAPPLPAAAEAVVAARVEEAPLPPLPEEPVQVPPPVPPVLPAAEGPPIAWINPAEMLPAAPASSPRGSEAPPSGRKSRWTGSSVRRFRFARRRAVIVASIAVIGGLGTIAARTERVQAVFSPLWAKITAWSNPPKPPPRTAPVSAPADAPVKVQAPGPDDTITPKAEHNEVVKRMLTERTLSFFQADLRQLVPFYNASASARNLPPQREMTEAFRKHYGILLDGFDRLTCLRAKGKDEFVFVLTSSTRVDIAAVLGSPATVAKDRLAKPKKAKSIHIYPIKTAGRVYGVAQFDPFTVILGSKTWIESSLQGSPGPSLREALCMFPDTASRNPGALIMVERIVPQGGPPASQVFQTAVSNLFFKGKGESRLTLTRNPDVKEELFVEQSSTALKEQASALIQAVKLSESLVPSVATAPSKTVQHPGDAGEIISTTEASITIPDGEALLREAIDSVAHSFMSQSPSVELILAAQKAVLNFNQARLKRAPETQSVTGVAEALELLQNGISVTGENSTADAVYQIERLEPSQADEIVHLLALDEKAGLIFRPNADHLSGTMLELALKARDYRNAELLISLWAAAKFTAADAPDVQVAVRKVTEWANNEGSRQRMSVGLPILTAAEYKNAVALLSIQNGQLTWKPGEEGYRTWLRRVSPDPKGDAKRIAGIFHAAQKAGAIPNGQVTELADAVRLINTGVRSASGARPTLYNTGNLTVDELRAAARYLRFERGAMRVVDR